MSDSLQDKLSRVRKPRVHITYDVETNGAQEKKELPFVVGVMGDYSGDNTASKKALKDRKFVQIDRDNFNDIMGKVEPTADLKVDDKPQTWGADALIESPEQLTSWITDKCY